MKGLTWLRRTLEASVARQGEKPLTNAYLLNIVKLAIKAEAEHEERAQAMLNEVMAEDRKWGSS